MRKLTFILLATLTALTASAQFRRGLQVGITGSTPIFEQQLISASSLTGPSATLVGEFMFTSVGIGLDFGLGYSMTGGKINLGEKPIWSLQGLGNETVRLHNIHIPVHLRYKFVEMQGLDDYWAPLLYFGPEFNIQAGHSGPQNTFHYSGGDVSLALGMGFELFKKVQLSGGYAWPLCYSFKTLKLDNFAADCATWHCRLSYYF